MPDYDAEAIRLAADGTITRVPLEVIGSSGSLVSQEAGTEWIVAGVSLGPDAPVLETGTIDILSISGVAYPMQVVKFTDGTDTYYLPRVQHSPSDIAEVVSEGAMSVPGGLISIWQYNLIDRDWEIYAGNALTVQIDATGTPITDMAVGEVYLADDDGVLELSGGLGETGGDPTFFIEPGYNTLDSTSPTDDNGAAHLQLVELEYATDTGTETVNAFYVAEYNPFTDVTKKIYVILDSGVDLTLATSFVSETVLPGSTEGMSWSELGMSTGLFFRDDYLAGSIFGRWGADSVDGTAGGDKLLGHVGNDLLMGADGDDTIAGGLGHDTLMGGNDQDALFGYTGDDDLDGGIGADTLFGGYGDDTLDGGKNADSVSGGQGDDSLLGNKGADTLKGGAGNDTLLGEEGDDSLLGDLNKDSLVGGSGFDTLLGGAGRDTLDGGLDDDRIEGNNGHDNLIGADGMDTLLGGRGRDTIEAGKGDDQLRGGDGDDTLSGGKGDDTLLGDAGNDTLNGGLGVDSLTGGAGADVFVFATDGFDDALADFENGVDLIDLDVAFGTLVFTDVAPGLVILSYAGENLVVTDTAGTLTSLDFDAGDFI